MAARGWPGELSGVASARWSIYQTRDSKLGARLGRKSTCNGACAVEWPPLRATRKPTVGSGVNAAIVATSTRSDGTPQVTYNGHPLYQYSVDQKAGDTNGQGVNAFGGLWYVLSPSGDEVTTPAGPGGAFGY